MIIIYKEISYSINQICSGHNCLVIPVSPQFPDVTAPKPDQNRIIKKCHVPYTNIYNFGTDEDLDHNNKGLEISQKESGQLVNDSRKKGKGEVGMQVR